MAETCVLGHAWTPGRVLCAVCGFGPRAVQPAQGELAAQDVPAPQDSEPELVVAGAATGGGRSLQLEEPATAAAPTAYQQTTAHQESAAAEQVLSPDGQWAWDGTQWVPATQGPAAPAASPQADPVAEPSHRRQRSRRTVDPKLLVGLLLVVAVAAGADLALKLPPLGHKASSTPAPVASAASTTAHQDAFAKSILRGGARTEAAYRARSGLYTGSVAQLQKAGMPAVAAPAVFAAQAYHGTGFCLVAGAGSGARFFLYDSVRAGLRPTVYPTEAAALRGCSQRL